VGVSRDFEGINSSLVLEKRSFFIVLIYILMNNARAWEFFFWSGIADGITANYMKLH
jgi:hypothetical protein